MKLCISEETYDSSEMESWNSSSSASAFLDFYVDRKFRESRAIAAHNFTGTQLRTKIKSIAVGGAGCGWGLQWAELVVGGAAMSVSRHTHIMLQILPIMLCSDALKMHQ